MVTSTRWGKAGVRLTDQEAEHRNRAAVATRNRRASARAANNRVAYRLWRAGELKPYLITLRSLREGDPHERA